MTRPLAIYVHWPFCAAKCPYCDFNSHVRAGVDHDTWARALVASLRHAAASTPDHVVQSIFFGGGTPSLMPPETVAAIIDAARGALRWANDVEITLEANPTSVDAARFAGYRQAGVNRLSLGVQALDDGDLQRLGRLHSMAEALDAVETAKAAFDRVSFDLIYARQGQTLSAWEAELARALSYGPDHLSLYQLTIEPGTVFAARHAAGHLRGLPGEDAQANMYEATQALCAEAGLVAYEVSNHARPGAESRHNLAYWTGVDFLGIGPGAHGRVSRDVRRWATEALSRPEAWLSAEAETPGAAMSWTALTSEDIGLERLLMGVRIPGGVPLDAPGVREVLDWDGVTRFEQDGLIALTDGHIRIPPEHRLLTNAILREITL
ncbi:MAG: radical SAM family heme chaperone HemW [Shimia sp.]